MPGAAGSLGPPQLLDNAPPTNTRTGRHETARYGLCACRIGEASHPGPSNRLFTATFLFEWLVIATCMVGRAAEAHKAVQGRDAATFAQSCRSRHAKRERRETARRIQWERACFELECRWAFATPRISRGTVRLVMTHPEFHVLAVGMPRRRSVFTRALMRRQHHYFAPSPTQLSRCGPREQARYGHRARRVGEASHPGPQFERRAEVLRALHRRSYVQNLVGGQNLQLLPSSEWSRTTSPVGAARSAARMLTSLARKARAENVAADRIPTSIQRQNWSELNVPLMWSAASQDPEQDVLAWIAAATSNAAHISPLDSADMSISAACYAGWSALRVCFRAWGIASMEDLADWVRNRGFVAPRVGEHIHKRAQEFILERAVQENPEVANIEIGYVAVALHLSLQPQLLDEIQEGLRRRTQQQGSTRPRIDEAPGGPQADGAAAAATPALATSAPPPTPATARTEPPASAWQEVADLDLERVLRQSAVTVREPPRWFRGSLRQAFMLALRAKVRHPVAAWKLAILAPRMLLAPTEQKGEAGKTIFYTRLQRFQRGEWLALLAEAAETGSRGNRRRGESEEHARRHRRQEAEKKVRLREVSRARVLLTSSGLAPGNEDTYEQLTNEERRPRESTEEPPADALHHVPSEPIKLDQVMLARSLRGAGRGSAPDLAGMRYEHLRVLLEDEEAWAMFTELAQDFAQARAPNQVLQALRLGRMTALQKDDGKVRGIVAGSILRRLVCKTVAVQFSDAFLERTAPFQFALQTKAGTDALAHAVRLLTDADPEAVVVSLDGIGAFAHVKRAAFFRKLLACEELRPLLPLVSALYGTQSRFLWYDDDGEERLIVQGEGGEQGCPLMPALYALAQHDALVEASGGMLPSEHLFSFLDDLYIVTSKARAAEAFEEVADAVERHAGVQSHIGKLKAWCKGGGPAPADLAGISEGAWKADLSEEENGLIILGTPLGQPGFVKAHAAKRLEVEDRLLRELSEMQDPQVAWVLLSQSAVPRSNHTLRVVPPSLSATYAQAHDDALWHAFCSILSAEEHRHDVRARGLASLPGRLGGLGLRSAMRTADAAYVASWIDALPVLGGKVPSLAASAVNSLESPEGPAEECLQELSRACRQLKECGADLLPSWHDAVAGAEPPQPDHSEDFETSRGWQWHACSARESFFAERVLKPISDEPQRAMVLSQGASGGAWLKAIPSETVFAMQALRFHVALRRRLRWPLPLAAHRCRGRACGAQQDDYGDHAASCNVSGLLKARSRPIEKVWARVLREGRARVRENVALRDAGIPVGPRDGRNIEIVATGLPVEHGIPMAVDATMVSPLRTDGRPHPRASEQAGVALERGRRAKETTYPELLQSSRLRLLTAGIETGGRLSIEGLDFLSKLAAHKTGSEPPALRASAARAWRSRWVTMISVVSQDALAATLVDDGVALLDAAQVPCPSSVEVWLDDRA